MKKVFVTLPSGNCYLIGFCTDIFEFLRGIEEIDAASIMDNETDISAFHKGHNKMLSYKAVPIRNNERVWFDAYLGEGFSSQPKRKLQRVIS